MQKSQTDFWRSLASIVSFFLVAGWVELFLIYSKFGEVLIPTRTIVVDFLFRTYLICFFAGTLIFLLAWSSLFLLRKIPPFARTEPSVSILSISVAAVVAAYIFDYVLQNILGNPLTRIDILFLFLGSMTKRDLFFIYSRRLRLASWGASFETAFLDSDASASHLLL